ncbi:MAG TPA: flavin reductase family protein [Devosia sp.]|nr:flavin reductase family protein [Devosia sp.]
MFYDPRLGNHGLPHNPFAALVVPRPIGWISTLAADGTANLAPYSHFNIVSANPAFVMFSSNPRKHSQANAEASGEFVVNIASWELREAMNLTSALHAADVSEFETAGLEPAPSVNVRAPRIARSPIAIECRYSQTVTLTTASGQIAPAAMVIGEVVGVYIADGVIVDGLVDVTRVQPLSRLGYMDYATVGDIFAMERPGPHIPAKVAQ